MFSKIWTDHRQLIINTCLVLSVSGITAFVNFRPLAVVFLSILAFWIYKTKFSNIKLQIPDNLTQAVQSYTSSVNDLRQNKPGTYLLLVSGSLVLCACIGHIISGKWVVLTGFIFAVLVSTKYQIKIIKENVEANPQLWVSQTDHDMDEFMPEVDESNMQLLNRFGENADVSSMYSRSVTGGSTPSPDDEIPAELLLVSPDALPEIDDTDSPDSDSSSISGLLLKQSVQQHDKQVAIGDTIRFKSGHFNGDSSSSDDDSITRGLSFSGHTEVDHKHQQRQAPTSTMSLINPLATATTLQFLGNMLSQAAQMQTSSSPASLVQPNPPTKQQHKVQRRDSTSDDSEFEILNTEELDVDT